MMNRFLAPLVLVSLAACARVSPPGDGVPSGGPLSALGGAGDVRVTALAGHGSGVYAVGFNTTDPDDPLAESSTFIRKHSTSGALVWRRQFRFNEFDFAAGVASDANNNAYVVGSTLSESDQDAFIRKYTAGGRLAWTRRFTATPDSPNSPYATYPRAVATYGGDAIYMVGFTYGNIQGGVGDGDLFIRKYAADGRVSWTRQFGFTGDPFGSDDVGDVAVDGHGNAYVVGVTDNASGGVDDFADAFVRKYRPDGGVAWTRKLNFSNDDSANAVAVSNGEVYLGVGYVAGRNEFGDPEYGVRVAKVFNDGGLAKRWGFIYNTPNSDRIEDLSADGNIYLSATTDVPGEDGYGVVVKLKPSGARVWSKRTGGGALVARAPNEVYVAAPPLLRRLDGTSGATIWAK